MIRGENMENEKGSIGKLFIIILIILIILGVCGIIFLIINDKEEKYIDKPQEEKKEEKVIVNTKYNSLKETIENLDYSKTSNHLNNYFAFISDYKSDNDKLVSINDGKVIFDGLSGFDWYGTFGITYDEDNTYIIDKDGNILYSTKDTLYFYSESGLWECTTYDKNIIYDSNGELFDSLDTYVVDDEGKYLFNYSDKLKVYDYSKKLIFEEELSDDVEIVRVVAGSSSYNQVYALVEIEDEDGSIKSCIINLKDGNIVYDYVNESIEYSDNNLFSIGDDSLFIYNDKVALKIKGEIEEYSLSDKYVNVGEDTYELSSMNKVNGVVYVPDIVEDNIIQRESDMEITACLKGLNIRYGLKYKDNEVLACKYESISYYDYDIHKELLKSNKLYVLVEESDNGAFIYDVYNNKKVNYIDYYGVVVGTYENEDSYFYNIITGKSVNNKNGEELLDSDSNYYVLTDEDETYYAFYDNNFKKFYEIK